MTVPAREFQGLDPDLPSIAAMAAAEVDGLMRHQNSNLVNLGRLAQVLTSSFETPIHGAGVRRMLDPVSANVFASTLRESSPKAVSSYDELANASLQLAEEMKKVSDSAGEAVLVHLKRFCLALSRYALASAENLDTVSNVPEYKR